MTGSDSQFRNTKSRRSVRGTFIYIAAIVTTIVAAGSIAAYVFVFSVSFGNIIKDKTDRIVQRLCETIDTPLWNFAMEVGVLIVESELRDEDILAIIVYDPTGQILIAREKSGKKDSFPSGNIASDDFQNKIKKRYPSARYSVTRKVVHVNQMIASATVIANGAGEYRAFTNRLKDMTIAALLVGILVAVMQFFTLDRLVSRRVLSLSRTVSSFAGKDFSVRADDRGNDEIGDLASAFNFMAETIQRFGDNLQGLIKEQTGRLIESEKLAFLGSLVAGVAHEVNTPLGVSVTAASHAKRSLETIKEGYRAGTMEEETFLSNLSDSIESLSIIQLNLSKSSEFIQTFKQLAADQSVEDRRMTDIEEYLNEIVLSLRPTLKRTAHVISIHCPKDLRVKIIPGALYQIVTNLLVNSVKHAFEKNQSGRIDISAHQTRDGLELLYKDNGKGIPPDILGRIFDPFFTTARDRGGTGLGLYIAKTIAAKHGGDIVCRSKEGEGVEFTVTLLSDISEVVNG